MSWTMVGYFEDIDPAGALANIAAIVDDHITTQADDIRVPREMENIIGAAVLIDDNTATIQARFRSPSLRTVAELDVEPIVDGGVVFGNPPEGLLFPRNPVPVRGDESIRLEVNSNPAAAEVHYGLLLFADGPIDPITGRIYRARATATISLSEGTWVNGNLVFDQTLPQGDYQVVGMRARGTNLVAARLNFVGGIWRPGCFAVNAISDRDATLFRSGGLGVWGRFNHTTPPTVECLGITDSAQTFILDLIKVG